MIICKFQSCYNTGLSKEKNRVEISLFYFDKLYYTLKKWNYYNLSVI